MAGRRRWAALGVRQLVVFLPFHSSVLKPNFDLPLRETKSVCNLNPPPSSQIPVKMKFLLEFQNLLSGVRCSGAFGFGSGVIRVHCGETKRKVNPNVTSEYRTTKQQQHSWNIDTKLFQTSRHPAPPPTRVQGRNVTLQYLPFPLKLVHLNTITPRQERFKSSQT